MNTNIEMVSNVNITKKSDKEKSTLNQDDKLNQ